MMRQGLQQRLETLTAEFDKGQSRLRELQLQQSKLHETLLRIDGAIRVLTELLEKEASDLQNTNSVSESVASGV